jgi:hypothetical protein
VQNLASEALSQASTVDATLNGLATALDGLDDGLATLVTELSDVQADLADVSGGGALSGVPVGTVLDWYRPAAGTLPPEGWALCDGQTVTDPRSPFVNTALPDCTGRFSRGVSAQAQVGVAAGADTHTHTVPLNHAHTASTASAGDHSHSVSVGSGGAHSHVWSSFNSSLQWRDGRAR